MTVTDFSLAAISAGPAFANDNGGGVGRDPFAAALVNAREQLRGYAMFLTRDHAEADDLVQETFARALVNRRQFATGTNLKAWTTSIMRSRFLDDRRRTAIRRRVQDLLPRPVPSIAIDRRLELLSMADVEDAVAKLPPDNGLLFRLAHMDGWSYQRLSIRFDIPVNTVGTRLRRLRQKVRVTLEQVYRDRCGDCEPQADDYHDVDWGRKKRQLAR